MVTSWILNSLSKDIADSVEYVFDSLELWSELKDLYDQTNGARLYQIQKEINDLSQGSLDITSYYTKMKKLWEELNNLCVKNQCSCLCTCGAKDTVYKAEQDRRLIQFLMGLNEAYTIIRGSILMMKPLPSMGQAFALLIQEEKQREFKPNSQFFADPPSMCASSSIGQSRQNGGNSGGRGFQTNYTQNTGGRGTRPFCEYCRRLGHIKDKCYKLHGYPEKPSPSPGSGTSNSNFTPSYRKYKGRGTAANVHGECSSEREDISCQNGSQSGSLNNLSTEQYTHLINLLQTFQGGGGNMKDPFTTSASTSSHNGAAGAAANFAGIIACNSSIDHGKHSCGCFKTKTNLWILDSGATHHITFDKSYLSKIITIPYPILVNLPNGYKVKVTQVGETILTSGITLNNVLFIPTFHYNLISISALTDHLKCTAFFTNSLCLLQAPSLRRPLEIGRIHDGLYLLCSQCLQKKNSSIPCLFTENKNLCSHSHSCTSDVTKLFEDNRNNISNSSVSHANFVVNPFMSHENTTDLLWHYRLGHVPFIKMKKLTSIPVKFSPKQPFLCPICPMARQSRLPFSNSTTT
ncbi:uncharacterized protein [Solanum lycopersicum]|uniref:uncharacterized protein isoform X1 n=1 Tax=Solanum lycopersicum TaxID=4081 RepID=UPI003747B19B